MRQVILVWTFHGEETEAQRGSQTRPRSQVVSPQSWDLNPDFTFRTSHGHGVISGEDRGRLATPVVSPSVVPAPHFSITWEPVRNAGS